MEKKCMLCLLALVVLITGIAVSESFLPDLEDVYGIAVPSFTDTVKRFPVSTENMDGRTIITYTHVKDEEYYAYGEELKDAGCEVRGFSVEEDTVVVSLFCRGKDFTLRYDNKNATLLMEYPDGVYEEPKMTPIITATPEPTPTPTPKPTPEPTPTPSPTPTPVPTKTPEAVHWDETTSFSLSFGDQNEYYLFVGDSLQLIPVIKSEDGGKHDKEPLVWESSDQTVVSVNEKGKITCLSDGDAIITCKSADNSNSFCRAFIHVAIQPKKIAITEEEVILLLDCDVPGKDQADLKIIAEPSNATCGKLIWKSSNEAVVTVDSSGHLTAVTEGTAQVIVTTSVTGLKNQKTAECKVRVVHSVKSIILKQSTGDDNNLNLAIGKTHKYDVEVQPANAGIKSVSWYSDDPSVATVDNAGKIRGVSKGTTMVTCEAADGSGIRKSLKISVFPPVKSLKANTKIIRVGENETVTLNKFYTIEPSDALQVMHWERKDPQMGGINFIGVDSASTILEGLYANGNEKQIITGRTTDGTNKSVSFTVYVIPKDGIMINLDYAEWWYLSNDRTKVHFQIENWNMSKVVEAVELYVFAEDAFGKRLGGDDKLDVIVTTKKIKPGKKVYSDFVYFSNRSKIKNIYAYIHKVRYADGQIVEKEYVNKDDWDGQWDYH